MSALKLSEAAVAAFERAAFEGTPQCQGQKHKAYPVARYVDEFGVHYTYRDEYCAVGLLERDVSLLSKEWYADGFTVGDEDYPAGCGKRLVRAALLVHLNDDHDWDWLTFARKLG